MLNNDSGYMPDLSLVSLDELKNELKTGRLLPSRKPLLDGIDEKFSILEKKGISNAEKIRDVLKTGVKLKKTAEETGIAEDYFKLLKREVNNLLPVPVKFKDVPNMPEQIVNKLDSLGIYDTEKLFCHVKDVESRSAFEKETGFTSDELLWLTKLVDVSRIKWVGPKLARLIVDTSYDTVAKLAEAEPQYVLDALTEAKTMNKAYDGPLGINDIESWIRQVVVKTEKVIEYL